MKNKNIIFVGGIHGVGKGILCTNISQKLHIQHLSASDLLRWSDLNRDRTNKKVRNIQDTQDRLIEGLKNNIRDDNQYILDGHFCLMNKNGEIQNVPLDTFEHISPIAILLIEETPNIVCERLQARDGKEYDQALIAEMQDKEVKAAYEVAEYLDIDCLQITSKDIDVATSFVKKIFAATINN